VVVHRDRPEDEPDRVAINDKAGDVMDEFLEKVEAVEMCKYLARKLIESAGKHLTYLGRP